MRNKTGGIRPLIVGKNKIRNRNLMKDIKQPQMYSTYNMYSKTENALI